MGFQFNGTQANVTLSGGSGLPIPAANQTPVQAFIVGNGAARTVYTVPAGKTFYLTGCLMCDTVATTPGLKDNADNDIIVGRTSTSQTAICLTGGVLAVYTQNQNVRYNGTATGHISIWGFIQ